MVGHSQENELVLYNVYGRKYLIIDEVYEYPNLVLPQMDMKKMMKFVERRSIKYI